ncbi:YhcB family protein [Amphritea atlantica]|uniref:Z-ring associated protein G n=1 Tax=Amphritea atlantica TaxID=355243 RepID=A0ABY5GV55_9GAMM|nr:YhcB family protein [Amphritea atlantica]
MEDSSVWIIGIVTLLAGTLIGYLMGRSGDTSSQQKLVDQLNEAQRDLSDYKEKVNGHFETTAELVNNLTESYKQVHQHLAQGSETLCMGEHAPAQLSSQPQPAISEPVKETAAEDKEPIPMVTEQTDTVTEEPEVVEPPRDYAIKSPDEEGTLSEKYGLKKKPEADEDEEIPPLLKDHIPGNSLRDSEAKRSA